MLSADLVLFLVALPFAVWATWMDFSAMRLPNRMNLLIAAIFIVVGLFLFPPLELLTRVGIGMIVLVVGFCFMLINAIGGGDVKYMAAIIPFIAPDRLALFAVLLACAVIVAYVMHRIVRQIGFLRNLAPDWKSWTARKFPMGFAISGAWLLFLGVRAFNLPYLAG